jgi:hypothetical protein
MESSEGLFDASTLSDPLHLGPEELREAQAVGFSEGDEVLVDAVRNVANRDARHACRVAAVCMRYSCTSSIRVPKLPLGWMKATVVPLEPGRGAWSIGVAPAATIEASASPQSATR